MTGVKRVLGGRLVCHSFMCHICGCPFETWSLPK